MITGDTYQAAVDGQLGSKALQLFQLQTEGVTVPPLIVLTCSEVEAMLHSTNISEELIAVIVDSIPASSYAVRSAVLIEDGYTSAHAGAFETELAVSKDGLASAILQIATDAAIKLKNKSTISIIIQEYIEADFGGVLFTRHPTGDYSQVIEYQTGSAKQVVHGGAVKRIEIPMVANSDNVPLPFLSDVLKIGKKIEGLYDWPQDIEWVVKDGVVYIVQTRPITTLSDYQWCGLKLLDDQLSDGTDYYFEIAPAAETFDRPAPWLFTVLQKLHAPSGPVERAYKRLGVQYISQGEHVQFGSIVYVDKEKELITLAPAYTYKRGTPVINWTQLRALPQTWRNAWRLERIPVGKLVSELQSELQAISIKLNDASRSSSEAETFLYNVYETIFSVSLCAQKALKDLTRFLGSPGRSYLSALLAADSSPAAETWLQSLPQWKRLALSSHITHTKQYMELREECRVIFDTLVAAIQTDTTPRNALDAIECELPEVISSVVLDKKNTKCQGVSKGRVTGELVSVSNLSQCAKPNILLVDALTPKIVEYFPVVSGVIAKTGGQLSHAAIMAREAGIPVVVGDTTGLQIGSWVEIDGSTGLINPVTT